VYQAYGAAIADYAVKNQRFGGDNFSYSRMSWIKPNFLWMMYRTGWATKPGQERILEIKIKQDFFDELLEKAVGSLYDENVWAHQDAWKDAVEHSEVRVQWDPARDPQGNPLQSRAVQLGLQGSMLKRYGKKEIQEVNDITGFVIDQRNKGSDLVVPVETLYMPKNKKAPENEGIKRYEIK
jgi:hypothetical protein